MRVLMFMPQFHEAIIAGTKRQTIRPKPKRPIKPGQVLSLRGWEGLSYRSKQFVLLNRYCSSVSSVVIIEQGGRMRIKISGEWRTGLDTLAISDGFKTVADMHEFWVRVHKIDKKPFEGVLITWFPD